MSKVKKTTTQVDNNLYQQQPGVWRVIAIFNDSKSNARLLQVARLFNKDKARLQPFDEYLQERYRSKNTNLAERYEEDKQAFLMYPSRRKPEHLFDDAAGKRYVVENEVLIKDSLFDFAKITVNTHFLAQFSQLYFNTEKSKFDLSDVLVSTLCLFLLHPIESLLYFKQDQAIRFGLFARKQILVSPVDIVKGLNCLDGCNETKIQHFIDGVIDHYESQLHVFQSDETLYLLFLLRSPVLPNKVDRIRAFMFSSSFNQGSKMYCTIAKELADLQAPQETVGTDLLPQ